MRVDMSDRSIAAVESTHGRNPLHRSMLAHLDVDPWTGWDGSAAPLVQVDTPKDAALVWVRLEMAPHDARKLAAALLEAANLSEPEAERCPWSVSYLPGGLEVTP